MALTSRRRPDTPRALVLSEMVGDRGHVIAIEANPETLRNSSEPGCS